MDNPSQSPQPELKGFCTYVVIIHIRDATHTDDFPTVSGVFMDFKEAVRCLRNQREQIEDGFIPPEDAAARRQHPFRNRIGHLRRSDGTAIGWGYSWQRKGSEYTNRTWIVKTTLWRCDDEVHDVGELTKVEMEEMEAQGDVDYVAFGLGGPPNGKFDEASKDFVFPGEGPSKDYSETSTHGP